MHHAQPEVLLKSVEVAIPMQEPVTKSRGLG
jgi:hypothetical protein